MGSLWVLAQLAPNFGNDPGELGNNTQSQEWGLIIAGLIILVGPFILMWLLGLDWGAPFRRRKDDDA